MLGKHMADEDISQNDLVRTIENKKGKEIGLL